MATHCTDTTSCRPGHRSHPLVGLALAALLLGASPAQATSITSATVSSGGNWGGAGNNTWTPSAAGSVVAASEVNAKLGMAGAQVEVRTDAADPALTVMQSLTLGATAHLVLHSDRDVVVQAPIHAAGAIVTMRYGQGSVAAGNTATVLTKAPVNLNSLSEYHTQLGSDGADVQHTIITSLGAPGSNTGLDLQGMQGNLAGRYVLGSDVDASASSGWNAGAGFTPVGPSAITQFTGTLDGLGHSITGLAINRSSADNIGLLGRSMGPYLRNLALLNVAVTGRGYVGALTGGSQAVISNIQVSGAVNGGTYVGSVAGHLNSTISRSNASADVNGPGNQIYMGGLIGFCSNCAVRDSYATGNVGDQFYFGTSYLGGLAGSISGASSTVENSYASGKVIGTDLVGGLAGSSTGTITQSYATGEVSGLNSLGGLLGLNYGSVMNSYATGDVSGTSSLGGLVGYFDVGSIANSYAKGSVTGISNVGGLLGENPNNIAASNSYYAASGAPGNVYGTAITPAQFATLATFAGWDIDDAGGTSKVWRIYEGQTAPLLRSHFSGPLTVTATSGSRPVDGTSNALGVTYTPASPDARLLGTAVATAAGSAVGPHAVTVGGVYSAQRGYDITLVPGTLTITAVAAPPAPEPDPPLSVTTPGIINVTDPGRPIIVGPDAGGASIVLPGTGSTPVSLQITANGQPLTVSALPGTLLQVTRVNGQSVLVLVVLQGWASLTSSAAGQPMALAGAVLLSSGVAGTRIEAQPLTVAVVTGSLLPPAGGLPELGGKGVLAGERLRVDAQGKLQEISLGSLKGDAQQMGDALAFTGLPASLTVDGKAFARLAGAVARLGGGNLSQGLEVAPSGVLLLRDGNQTLQLLPAQPITIDARLPDGLTFTPLGLLRWVRGGVVVQFAPAVADLAGLASAVTGALPGATLKLGAEGVLQLRFGGNTYVLKPDWTGAGAATGTPQIGVDEQGRIVFQVGMGARQLLLPALLNVTQASGIFSTAIPGAILAIQPGSSEGAFTVTLAGQAWRLVPQWVLPGNDSSQKEPWRMGADGLLYLKLGTQLQGVGITD